LDDSDAIDGPRWVTLNNVDLKAPLPQCDGSSQAANAPTNDQYADPVHGVNPDCGQNAAKRPGSDISLPLDVSRSGHA
jgi:hypothetical protein